MAVGSFLKRGKDAQKVVQQEEERQEAARKNTGAIRFWLPPEKEAQLTFLDGKLDEDGMLDVPVVYEHQVFMNGSWKNWFVCISDSEPCPICDSGERPSLVALMTVIDHSQFKDRQGNVRKDELRLYAAKRNTMKQLQKYASKRKGLAGCTFDVSRMSKESPNVGDVFDFVDKAPVEDIKKQYGVDVLDYEEILNVKTAKELRSLGFGTGEPIGSSQTEDGDGDGDGDGGAFDPDALDAELG